MALYPLGSLARLSAAFTNQSNVPADPTSILLRTKDPNGLVVVFVYGTDPIVKDSVGNYHFDLVLGVTGRWLYRWEGTGAITAAGDGNLVVAPSIFYE